MGTNYYLTVACDSCNREEVLHIGKSSMGWVFALHVEICDGQFPVDIFDWLFLMAHPLSTIVDEYDIPWTLNEMLEIITDRHRESPPVDFPYDSNHAQPGPYNLIRSKVCGNCVGHGEGTWDHIQGEFS